MASEARRLRRAAERADRKRATRLRKGPRVELDMTLPVLDYGNRPIADGADEMTLRSAIWLALNSLQPGENPPPDEKMRRYRLTSAAFANDKLDLDLEDAAFIKEKSGQANAPLIHGRLSDALQPPKVPEPEVDASTNGQGEVTEAHSEEPPVGSVARWEEPAAQDELKGES